MFSLGRLLGGFGVVLLFVGTSFGQQFYYENTPVLTVINDIEQKTSFRFLYREALIANVTVSFTADSESLFPLLTDAISEYELGLKVDQERKQALIYTSSKTSTANKIKISGFILDDLTGERLPFATLSWRNGGVLDGIISTANGQFDLSFTSNETELLLMASYVGYENEQIRLNVANENSWKDLSIRLSPKPYGGKEIIVQGVNFYTPNDTVLNGLMKIGTFSPLGESNAVRSLQMLPSVSMNAALSDGINIRGSSSDGFQILLDGQTLYSQNHLFGLLDAMNSDVLKSSGFFYDITPAQYQAPLGGTLSLITRTGSLNEVNGSVGISNTAVKSTLEGPIIRGTSSWLISGRWSYLDEIDWFNNARMIEYGLDVNRPADLIAEPFRPNRFVQDISFDPIDVQNTSASFYDLHGKVYFETASGSQFVLSSYLGSDEASQDYLREERNFTTSNTTNNKWDNASISGQFHTKIAHRFMMSTSLGYTSFNSSYQKDDFEFPATRDTGAFPVDSVIIQPLQLENEISQFDIKQTFSIPFEDGNLDIGFSYSDFDVRYTELSLNRNSFLSRRTSQLFDLFQQFDLDATPKLNVSIGNRLHYFSNGQYLKWSPRLKFSYKINEDLSLGSGFSRNYQFINRIEYYNINSNDFWILTNEDQPPSSVNYFTSGVYYNASSSFYVQLEGYVKYFNNLRLHELNTGLASSSFRNNDVPWYYENEGKSRGIEFLMKNRFNDLTLSSAYSLSISEIKNERINDGEYFYASWDRRHQITSAAEIDLKGGFTLLGSWIYGTGIPSRAELLSKEIETTRLPNYSRFDVSFTYSVNLGSGNLDANISIYNAFDRANTWYSERKQVTVTTRNNVLNGSAVAQVYDLGIQPSFSLTYSF